MVKAACSKVKVGDSTEQHVKVPSEVSQTEGGRGEKMPFLRSRSEMNVYVWEEFSKNTIEESPLKNKTVNYGKSFLHLCLTL